MWTDVRACEPVGLGRNHISPLRMPLMAEGEFRFALRQHAVDAQAWILYGVLLDLLAEGNNVLRLVQDEVRC